MNYAEYIEVDSAKRFGRFLNKRHPNIGVERIKLVS
jgi:hypothetical protein